MEEKLKTIESLEEEINRLKLEIERKKQEAEGAEKPLTPEKQTEITKKVLEEHIEKYPPKKLGEEYRISEEEIKKQAEKLEPEEDDRKIEGLVEFAKTKGALNAFILIKEMLKNDELNAHLVDDLHRQINYWKNFEQ